MAIQTPRLLLRRLQRDDGSDLLEYWADESLFQFDARPSLDEDQIVPWLERISQVNLTQTAEWFPLGIVEQATGKLIGDAGIHIQDSNHLQAQVALYLNPQFHRQGFGAETLAALQVFCFREIGMHRITAACDSRNLAALALFNRSGLRREGEFIQDREVDGDWVNTVWFAMLREEYQRRTPGGI
jgi:RimJ/RimL family protein N-acetyltransferase